MHETVQFLERNGYWLLVGAVPGEASLSANTCEPASSRGGLARSGSLSLPGAVGLVRVNLRAPASRWHCGGRVSSMFDRSSAAFGHGVTAAIPLPLKCGFRRAWSLTSEAAPRI